ncbi:hypothetical protein Glove_130g30 [Diversispora epigaea]|uniref:Uncharacterized protein n=1 Tax=Diversispora epigaea TaxID=1348612 RepID=A0A397J815_9GLOM|nr:hypothetical protein Glove_130g30 [Diversispora epigaea]
MFNFVYTGKSGFCNKSNFISKPSDDGWWQSTNEDGTREVHEAESEEHHELFIIMLQECLIRFHLRKDTSLPILYFVSEDWWQGTEEKSINYIKLSIQKWASSKVVVYLAHKLIKLAISSTKKHFFTEAGTET